MTIASLIERCRKAKGAYREFSRDIYRKLWPLLSGGTFTSKGKSRVGVRMTKRSKMPLGISPT